MLSLPSEGLAAEYHTIDLARLGLSSGEGRRLDVLVHPEGLRLAGQRYEIPDGASAARLDVSRTTGGYALRLRFSARLSGPCMRCLEDARHAVEVDAREVNHPAATGEDMHSPYVSEEELDLASWARDALALSLPHKILCDADCAGICEVCGERIDPADPGAHEHDRGIDPRWAPLEQLRDRLEGGS